MRVSLSTYGSRVDVEPMMGLAAQRAAPGAPVRMCAPPDYATAEECECDAPVATGVMPTGGWR
jgi:vancomycin aglycone glucosyltransferase